MCPAGPSTSSSKMLARPPQILLTTDVPSYSARVGDALSGCSNRDTWVFQTPKLKSKSWLPAVSAARQGATSQADAATSRHSPPCNANFMHGITHREMRSVKSHFGEDTVDHSSRNWLRGGA